MPFIKYGIAAVLLSIPVISSCVAPAVRTPLHPGQEFRERDEIVRYALSHIGLKDLTGENESFRNDCSGFVIGVYESSGYHINVQQVAHRRISEALYRGLRISGLTYINRVPQKADVVFFTNTTDDRRSRISHMGIVADTLRNGTVLIVHYGSAGVSEMRMNPGHPHLHMNGDGVVLNDFLKNRPKGGGGGILSGELFYSYGDLYTYAYGQKY